MPRPVDNFNDNAIDTSTRWAPSMAIPYYYGTNLGYTAGGTVGETNQRLELTPNAGVSGLSSLDTSIDDTDHDFIIKLTDLDVANMSNGDSLLFGMDRSDASRYAMFMIVNNFGTIQIEWLYLGRSGHTGTAPPVIEYNAANHVWFKIRPRTADNNSVEWSVAPAGSGPDTPGAWTMVRQLSSESTWADHIAGGSTAVMTPVREGVWAHRTTAGTTWVPKVDNFNFSEAGAVVAKHRITLFGA